MIDYFLIIFILLITVFLGFFLFLTKKTKIDESQTEAIRELERRLTDLMLSQLKEIRGTVDGTSRSMMEQISSFTKGTVQISEQLKGLQEKVNDISSFQEIFRTPKLRGQWGEASLEHVLSNYFPKEFYKKNHRFLSGEQVEFVIKLPNGKILPIDAKFFSDNFEKMIETEDEEKKEYYKKRFVTDIKFNIDKISSKYILPHEGTLDYALMYIPAEAIFHKIMYDLRDENLGEYARKKKVIITSPNTIYLTLRTIIEWIKDVQLSQEAQEILKKLARIQQDAQKLMEDFKRLGSHLRNATNAYDSSEKRLSLFTERVEKIIETKEPKELNQKNQNYDSSN